MIIAPQAGDVAIYSDPEQQCVTDHQSHISSLEMTAAEETTTVATMRIAPETGDLYSSPQKQRIQDHGFDPNAPGKTKTATQTIDSICGIYGRSDHSEPTIESCSSSGESVCSEDYLTRSDSAASFSPSRITAISIQQQMEALHATVSCPYLDSADKIINLPDDVIRKMLGKLDVKDIVQLSSLSRSWYSELPRILSDDGKLTESFHTSSGHYSCVNFKTTEKFVLFVAYLALRHRSTHELHLVTELVCSSRKGCDSQLEDDGAETSTEIEPDRHGDWSRGTRLEGTNYHDAASDSNHLGDHQAILVPLRPISTILNR